MIIIVYRRAFLIKSFIITTVGSARASGRQRGSVADEAAADVAAVDPWHHKTGLPRHSGPEPQHSEVSGQLSCSGLSSTLISYSFYLKLMKLLCYSFKPFRLQKYK